jgi:hypothetical protein
MKQHGRKSAASEAAIVVKVDPKRPAPPARLSREEAETWRRIVARMPAGWFSDESLPLLERYVAHVRSARMYEAALRRVKSISSAKDLKRFRVLTQLHERETRQVSSLSAKMRLSQQARYVPHTAFSVLTRQDKAEAETPLWDINGKANGRIEEEAQQGG